MTFFNVDSLKKIFYGVVIIKVLAFAIFAALGFPALYEVSDANTFDSFVHGDMTNVNITNVDKNPWAISLKILNNLGLYSRPILSIVLFLINCFLLPWLLAKSLTAKGGALNSMAWLALIFLSLYPTLNFYSTDVYREAIMVALFMVIISFLKELFISKSLKDFININRWQLFGVLMALYILFLLRSYLVFAMLLAFVSAYLMDCSKRLWFNILMYIVILWLADQVGIFDVIKGDYRKPYEIAESRYGIDYSREFFLVAFIKSFFYSVYGLSFSSILSYAFFIAESIPALIMTFYALLNRAYMRKFANFLIIFFFIYAAAWNVGVDALGTAVRYRIFNYIAILVAFFIIFNEKNKSRH